MARRPSFRAGWLWAAFVAGLAASAPAAAAQPEGAMPDPQQQGATDRLLDGMPLLFVPEQMSSDGGLGYAVRGRQASVWLSDLGITYRLHPTRGAKEGPGSWVVALDLVGAKRGSPVGDDLLPTVVSYFTGPKERWRTGLPTYGSVVYREAWPGVDLLVSGTDGQLKSSFVVRPGVDPGVIRLAYRGATRVRLEPEGSLVVDTPLGEIREQRPFAFQDIDGRRVEVAAAFELEPRVWPGRQEYRFRLGEYDPGRELVVDPLTLVYCGYIGGSALEIGYGIAVDPAGNAYVIGTTTSTQATFPVTVGPDLSYNGGDDGDAFVAKVNADGSGLDYCGYIGGSGSDEGEGIAVDAAGSAYVTGFTDSTEATFPVTVGPDLSYNGGDHDAFVAKVNPAGTALDYCGYVGGSEWDRGFGIAVDIAGNAFVAGDTGSSQTSFPVAVGPDLTYNGSLDVFVAKVDAAGIGLDYCGYIGGIGDEQGLSIAVDEAGNAYATGWTDSYHSSFPVTVGPDLTFNGFSEAFIARVNATGSGLDYCGYIGGEDDEQGLSIAVDGAGNAYVAGRTGSTESGFPVTVGPDLSFNGARDAFVAKVNEAGTSFVYCGYVGGSGDDQGFGVALDAAGNAFVAGSTRSTEATFPVTVGPDLSYNGGYNDAFVARVSVAGSSLDYCGYIGGSGGDTGEAIAVHGAGTAFVTGYTSSTEAEFPVTDGPDLSYNGGGDAFVAKVDSAEFFLEATPTAVEICAGSDAEYTVDVGSIGGYSDQVTLAAAGIPAGLTADFSVNPVTPPGSSVLTIGNTAGATGGSYTVTVSGTAGGGASHTVELGLDVVVLAPPPTPIAPPDGAGGQPLRPLFQWTTAAGADSYSLEVDNDPAFSSPEISVSGISGTSYSAPTDLGEDTTYSWRVRSENLCGDGAPSTVFSFTTLSSLPFEDGFESGDTSVWSATVP